MIFEQNIEEFDAVIEIPLNGPPIKYEVDHRTNMIVVDRFIQSAMFYPANYGFIPNTLAEDGDPVDVMIISHYPVIPGAVMRVRPVGVLLMEDDKGVDVKIITVPVSKVDITFDKVKELEDVDDVIKNRIKHFFEHYKELDKGKWVKVEGWGDRIQAMNYIDAAITRYNE